MSLLSFHCCLHQGVEPFKISLRFRFRFKKFYFYRFSSGSGSRLFKNLGSGSVRVQLHQNFKIRVHRNQIFRFRFDSSLLNPNFKGLGSVRVHRKKAVFTGSRFRFGFTSKCLIWPKTKLGSYIIKITKYILHARIN